MRKARLSRQRLSKQEALEHNRIWLQNKRERADRLIESWSRTRVGYGLDSLARKGEWGRHKARAVSESFDAFKAHLTQLKNAGMMTRSVFPTTPENLYKVIRIGKTNSNRDRIFTEWNVTTPDDTFYFVNTEYGVTARGVNEGDLIYENSSPDAASSYTGVTQIGAAGDGANLSFSGNLLPAPLVPNSVRVFVSGKPVGNDDGNGNIVGTNIDTGSTIDYATGAITVVFTAGNAPATGAKVQGDAVWDAEDQTLYDDWMRVKLSLTKQQFDCRIHPLTYEISALAALTLSTTGIGDSSEMLIKRAGDAHAARKDLKAFQIAAQQARRNPSNVFDTNFGNAGADSQYAHAQTIMTTLKEIDGQVYNEIERGSMNRIIAGSDAIAQYSLLNSWKESDVQGRHSGSYLAGTIGETIEVYCTPAKSQTVAANESLLVYHNTEEDGDMSIVFAVMSELFSTLQYPELYEKSTLATVEDHKVINPSFVRPLTFVQTP